MLSQPLFVKGVVYFENLSIIVYIELVLTQY